MSSEYSRTRRYLLGLITGYASAFAGILVGLWLTPFVLRHLDREAYGIFALGSDIIGWLALLDIGISAGLNVHLAQRSGHPSAAEISLYASSTFFAQVVLVMLMLGIGLIIALGFSEFFDVPKEFQTKTTYLMVLLVVGSALSLGVRTFSAILVAHQQIHVDNLIQLGLLAIRTTLIVILLKSGWGLLSLGLASLAAISIAASLSIYRSFRLSISPSLFSWDVLKQIGGVGIWFSLGGLAGLVILNLDRMVAGKLVSLEAVTVLVLTGRLYSLAQSLLNQVSNTARPALGQLLGQGKRSEALLAYRQMFTLSNGLAIVVGLAILAGNREFVRAWVGIENYGGTSLDVALFLNLLVNIWILPNRAVLSSGLVVKPQALSRIVEGFVNIALSILLTLRFGLLGVALSTSIAALVTSFWYLPRLTARLFEQPYIRFWLADGGRQICFLVAMLPATVVGREIAGRIGGIPGACIGGGSTGVLGFSILWFFVFDRRVRTKVLELVPRSRYLRKRLQSA